LNSLEKAVLITGAAGGIGSALVSKLSKAGWLVLASDKPGLTMTSTGLNECIKSIPADLESLCKDAKKLDNFRNAIIALLDDVKYFSIVHNAAIQCLGRFDEISMLDWNRTFAINVMAPVMISQMLLPSLRVKHGSIVHIGSIHSKLTKPGFTAYSTSKSALIGLTQSMAVELGGSVRVNAIEPAAISTQMLNDGFRDSPEQLALLNSFHPTGAIGCPEDVVSAVMFLLDPSNKFLNGCVLPLGGGIHSRLHDPA